MAKRRSTQKPIVEYTNKVKPNIPIESNGITRSKPIVSLENKTTKKSGERSGKSLTGVFAPQKRSIPSVKNTDNKNFKHNRELQTASINRSKPIVNAQYQDSTTRSKVSIQKIPSTYTNTSLSKKDVSGTQQRPKPKIDSISSSITRSKSNMNNIEKTNLHQKSIDNDIKYSMSSIKKSKEIGGTEPNFTIGQTPRTTNGPLRVSDL